jgi:uncharacterized protein (TIGR00106 family)
LKKEIDMSSEKTNKVVAYFTVVPLGQKSTSIGEHVATAITTMNKIEGLKCELTPMGTVIEADSLDTIFEAVKAAHEALVEKGIQRVESTLLIDDRRDKPRTMNDKVHSVKKHMEL